MRSAPVSGLPFRYYNLLWARPGDYDVRVLVRESKLGRMSTYTTECHVPDFVAGELPVSGPVFIDTAHPGMVLRGLDPGSPPEHKAGGPVAYPFLLGGKELTPSVVPEIAPGDSLTVLLVAHHPERQPPTGQIQAAVTAEAVNAMGVSRDLGDISIVHARDRSVSNGDSFLLDVRIRADTPTGFYELRVTVDDALKGTRATRSAAFEVVAK